MIRAQKGNLLSKEGKEGKSLFCDHLGNPLQANATKPLTASLSRISFKKKGKGSLRLKYGRYKLEEDLYGSMAHIVITHIF